MTPDALPWWGWLVAASVFGLGAYSLQTLWVYRPKIFWYSLALTVILYGAGAICLAVGLVRLAKWAWA